MKESGKCSVEYLSNVNLTDYYTFISPANRKLATTFRGQKSPTAVGYRLEDSGDVYKRQVEDYRDIYLPHWVTL